MAGVHDMEVEAVVTKRRRSVYLRITSPDATRLGLRDGQRIRIAIHEANEFAALAGLLKGRVPASRLHALTNEGEKRD